MLSNKQVKLIRSLQKKKYRDIYGLYIIEGDKLVREYLEAGEEIRLLAGKPEWIASIPDAQLQKISDITELSYSELKKVSSLSSPHNSLALVKSRKKKLSQAAIEGNLSLALDFIQDPGNMGTIIRTAAWFGIKNIICSANCVDAYNPKVVQATMGGLLLTDIYYTDLPAFLGQSSGKKINIYAATLDGKSMYEEDLDINSIILFGNESTGVSEELMQFVSKKIIIPSGQKPRPGIESLNVATSAAIICSEFIRRKS
jgi:TrmH family RNA methyltransferase